MLTLHIGLPKTGTTFLQRQVFAGTEDLVFLHRRQGPEAEALCRDLKRYVKIGPLVAAFYRHRIRRRLSAMTDAGGTPRFLVSDENIAMSAVGFWQGRGPEPLRVAARIAEILPRGQVRVVIGIRRQDQWLASRYAESSRRLGGLGQADFDRRMREIATAATLRGPLAWLDYGAIHECFSKVLGPENVKLVSLERIVAAPAATIRELGDFTGTAGLDGVTAPKPNRASRNRLSKGPNTWRMRKGGDALHLSPEVEAALLDRFALSNDALGQVQPDAFGF